MLDDQKGARQTPANAIFTWQNFPWAYLLFLVSINAAVYGHGTKLLGDVWFYVAIYLTFCIYLLGIILVRHRFRGFWKKIFGPSEAKGRYFFGCLTIFACLIMFIDDMHAMGELVFNNNGYHRKAIRKFQPIFNDKEYWWRFATHLIFIIGWGVALAHSIYDFWTWLRKQK